MGHSAARVHRASGMILNPRFYETRRSPHTQRKEARAGTGVPPRCSPSAWCCSAAKARP